MRHRPATSCVRSGFSLIELILVLSILGVLATIATPRYSGSLANYRSDAAARRVVADLTLARSLAMQRSRSVTVTFDAAAETYAIAGVADPLTGEATYTVDLTRDPYASTIHALQLSDSAAAITFDGYGAASAGGTISLASGGRTRAVSITATDGKASVAP